MMTPSVRKFALTTHVASSVGLLGSIAAFLALAVAGLTSQDVQMARFAYPAMELIAQSVIVPLAFASLLTGIIQSLSTPWGLFRHYWVLAKFLLTAFAATVLLVKMQLVGYAAYLAQETVFSRDDLHAAGLELVVHAAGGLLVLLVPTVLSVYKPRGLTRYGRRMQHEPREPSQQPYLPSPHSSRDSVGGVWAGRPIVITLRRAYVLGTVVIVAAAHVVILHAVGGGLSHH